MAVEGALTGISTGWTARDYVSPGLRVVTPDAAFPHMRVGDAAQHPWKYLRRDVPHLWYVDERYPLMGFLGRDEATLLHNIALQFEGRRALEIGSWLGWSTCHLALAGVMLDVIDPAHDDPFIRADVESSLAACGVADRVTLLGGSSPDSVHTQRKRWSLFFIDGDHEGAAPVRDTLACLPHAADDCAFVFHDVASPAVCAAVRLLADRGFHVVVYQTAQMMALAWRGDVLPIEHVPDPDVAWQVPPHVIGLPIAGVDFVPPPRSTYPQLRDVVTSVRERHDNAPPLPTVCIVTSELIGLFRNGGIGTATTGLAELLAAEGMRVTVLYTGALLPVEGMTRWRAHYRARGIELHTIELEDFNALSGPAKDQGFGVPWLVFEYLSAHHFDVVHFNDCAGEGCLALVARRLGIRFQQSLLVVGLHSPSRWVLELNQTLPSSLVLAAFHGAEHLAIRSADVLWSPSRYMLDWAAARDFALPPQTFIQQYAMPLPRSVAEERAPIAVADAVRGHASPPAEIVFFGRLEERKGLRTFCNAVHLLRDRLAARGITVTFLGKPERCGGMPSLEYIGQRASAWQFPVRTITDLGQPEAIQHLRSAATLAVMASPFDNSPCTVYEALAWGIPFLAARTGGIPELIHPDDQEHVLFDPSARSLAAAIERSVESGAWIARPAIGQDDVRRTWTAFHAEWQRFIPPPPLSVSAPAVAALIDHRPGDSLTDTLQGLARCGQIARIVVLNRTSEALAVPSVDMLGEEGRAVEEMLASIQEDAVLLVHSGVRIRPEALTDMLRAFAASNADGLSPAACETTDGRSRVVQPLGGSAPFGLFEGATFTGAMLLTREAIVASRRGHGLAIDVPFVGLADLCIAAGRQIWPYPVPVVERSASTELEVRSDAPARIAWYAQAEATDRYYMLAAGYAAATKGTRLTSRMSVALAAAGIGLAPLIRIAVKGLQRLRRWTGR